MAATYLVRIDDICPTMNWTVWEQVEAALVEAGVQPIVAVVPDNRDPVLEVQPAEPRFWDRVRRWQALGWTIGLHGYQHHYETRDAGIIGRNRYSEFAGLPFETQLDKLRRATAIFTREGVTPDVFVAPGHSFDDTTLRALLECGISAISDGYSMLPHIDGRGMIWVPQQLGGFRSMPGGLWTVCLHINGWCPAAIREFRTDLDTYRGRISGFPKILARYSRRGSGWADRLSTEVIRAARSLRQGASQLPR
jgi:predicted deacetylase